MHVMQLVLYLGATSLFTAALLWALGARGPTHRRSADWASEAKHALDVIDRRLNAGEFKSEEALLQRNDLIDQLAARRPPLRPHPRHVMGLLLLGVTGVAAAAGAMGPMQSVHEVPPTSAGLGEPVSLSKSEDAEILASLRAYTGKVPEATQSQAPQQPASLPDVETMISRLAERLERDGGDVQGWRMLGWSYASTGALEKAQSAYAKALSLSPDAAEIKAAYEEVSAAIAREGNSATAPNQTDAK
ncbi:MAG: hypothetical protein WC807_12340 [Hyphomicrobium sp.]|jgi:tetratricopeptide (TPR) repeat protein